jgi:CheY-like chemotaxis protein
MIPELASHRNSGLRGESLACGDQYLSTIDTPTIRRDDVFWMVAKKGFTQETNSALVLTCSLSGAGGTFGRRASTSSSSVEASTSSLKEKLSSVRTGIFMTNPKSLVSIVDDDESVRESLPDLLKELGFASEAFSSAEEFLAKDGVSRSQCLILDVAMPGMTGPELQTELIRREVKIPIIFITAHRDEAERSRLIERGAIACLIKPFSDIPLLEALNSALHVR